MATTLTPPLTDHPGHPGHPDHGVLDESHESPPGRRPDPDKVPDDGAGPGSTSRLRRLVRGRPEDPGWVRPSVIGVLVATAVLYMWGLGASGWANSFYTAAVQAGTKSWKAMFFGSSDAANFITVDKPPAALWIMEISARIFGLNSWSVLVPQALEGVAAVGILYTTVRRWFKPSAGLIAAAIMAVTPVAALMFRFNNPDALLVLLLTAGAYFMTRAVEDGSTKWLMFAFSAVGFGFLTKMLQALIVVPAFALVYLFAGPPKLGKRLWQLVLSGVALIVSAGWWVAIVELWPKSSRPYIGGSTDNSVLNLVFGYNGFGRLTGSETGSVGGGVGGGTSMWGATGWLRMFNSEFGGQASWLLPSALILLVAGLVLTFRRARTSRTRAAFILWGGWLLGTAITFSLGKGIIHPYYTVALAPAIGALVGIGAAVFWNRRNTLIGRAVLAATLGAAVVWAYELLDRTPNWNPWLRYGIVAVGLVGEVALLAGPKVHKTVGKIAVAAALTAGLAGPTAYSIATAATAHTGSIPSAGPSGGRGGFGGFGGGPGGFGGGPGGFGGQGGPPTGATGTATGGTASTQTGGPSFGGGQGGFGGIGGLLNATAPSADVVTALQTNAGNYTWVLATIGANNGAGYQIASGEPVMAIGGFNGTDATPTLTQFESYVTAGKIHYFVAGGTGGNSGTSSQITTWVEANFKTVTIGSTTFYDLTSPTAAA